MWGPHAMRVLPLLCLGLAGASPAAAIPVSRIVSTSASGHFGDTNQILKPASAAGEQVGIVAIQGAQIPTAAYVPLMESIQKAAAPSYAVFAAVPAFIGDVPEPLQIGAAITSAKKALIAAGMNESSPVVMFAHSLGGVMLQDYVFSAKDCRAQILAGASLGRKYRNSTSGVLQYPVPTLTLAGTLDGLYRLTRQAETYYHQILHPGPIKASDFPLVVYEGVSHMQFASGPPPANVRDHDLEPEVTYAEAHAMMASTIVNFMKVHIGGAGVALDRAGAALTSEVRASASVLQPLVEALTQEAHHHFRSACDSDYPMPECPFYPRYPSSQQGSKPQTGCTCGTPFSARVAQVVMGGALPEGVTIEALDSVHSVADVDPIHLPHIWNNCSLRSRGAPCVLNTTTVTQAIYADLDGLDTGFFYQSASELRVKLKSRQSILLAAGVAPAAVNFTATDVVPSLCAAINNASYRWALDHAGPAAAARFGKIGEKFAMGADIFLSNAGPAWIWNPMQYNAKKGMVEIRAPCSHTPVDYPIHSAAGYHYCKVLSPARAMEWIYIDGLRLRGSLKHNPHQSA